MKKFICLIMIMFMFVFGGCSNLNTLPKNTLTRGVTIYENGEIEWELSYFLNTEKYKKNGLKSEEILCYIELMFASLKSVKEKGFETRKTDEINVEILKVNHDKEQDIISFKMRFDDSESYSKFFSSTEENEGENESEKDDENDVIIDNGLFIRKETQKQKYPFNDKAVADAYLNIIQNCYNICIETYYQDLETQNSMKSKFETPKFVFRYGTYYNRLHTNADFKFASTELIYYHYFIEDYEDIVDGKTSDIEFYIKKAKPAWWYIVALGSVLVVTGIVYLGYFIINRKKAK